ncbi:MAG: hypothetical protein IJL67_06955 [Oscillospiraceae bacterium]|nr:hypothetical protein [Oscillospiraceae bacterium]
MDTNDCVIIGGVAIVAVAICYAAYKVLSKKSGDYSEIIKDVAEEQLVVDKLSGSDLTPWFKKNNPNGKLKNVLIQPNNSNLQKFHLPKNINCNNENMIVQILYDEIKEKVIKIRVIEFEELTSSMAEIFNNNDGVIFIE